MWMNWYQIPEEAVLIGVVLNRSQNSQNLISYVNNRLWFINDILYGDVQKLAPQVRHPFRLCISSLGGSVTQARGVLPPRW